MKVRKIQSRTGKGVRIGDSESQIIARLGRPTKIERSGAGQIRVLRYGDREAYVLCAGTLVQIQVNSYRDEDED